MSFLELLIIIAVALIVIKPERLPEVCYFLGRTFARLRNWYQKTFEKYQNFL